MAETTESLSHTRWDCKYPIVFIPKCRRAVQRGLRSDIVTLCVCPQMLPCKRPSAGWCAREHGVSRQYAYRLQQEFSRELADYIRFRGQRFQRLREELPRKKL